MLWGRPSRNLGFFCTKSPISRLVWQIERRCLGLPGGFPGLPIQWNHAKCCGANPCCHDNKIWARRGDPVTYRLVYLFTSMNLYFNMSSASVNLTWDCWLSVHTAFYCIMLCSCWNCVCLVCSMLIVFNLLITVECSVKCRAWVEINLKVLYFDEHTSHLVLCWLVWLFSTFNGDYYSIAKWWSFKTLAKLQLCVFCAS